MKNFILNGNNGESELTNTSANLFPFSVKEYKPGFNLFKRILGDIIAVKYDKEYIF